MQISDVAEAAVFQDTAAMVDIFMPISESENSKDQIFFNYIEYDEKELVSKNSLYSTPVSQRSILVAKIVEIEGPIHQDEVARRLTKSFGKEKAGDKIKAATLEGLKCAAGLTVENDFWSVAGKTKKIVRNRSKVVNRNLEKAEYLPPSEIRTALEYLVRSSVQIEYAELVQQVSRLFGFQRCGPDLKTVIGKELDDQVGKTFLKTDQYISFIK